MRYRNYTTVLHTYINLYNLHQLISYWFYFFHGSRNHIFCDIFEGYFARVFSNGTINIGKRKKLAQLYQVAIHFHADHPQLKTLTDSSDALVQHIAKLDYYFVTVFVGVLLMIADTVPLQSNCPSIVILIIQKSVILILHVSYPVLFAFRFFRYKIQNKIYFLIDQFIKE